MVNWSWLSAQNAHFWALVAALWPQHLLTVIDAGVHAGSRVVLNRGRRVWVRGFAAKVPVCGAIMIGGQRVQAGLSHAGKTAEGGIEVATAPPAGAQTGTKPRPAQPAPHPKITRAADGLPGPAWCFALRRPGR